MSFKHNEEVLQDFFGKALNKPVAITITENSVSLISTKAGGREELFRYLLHGNYL